MSTRGPKCVRRRPRHRQSRPSGATIDADRPRAPKSTTQAPVGTVRSATLVDDSKTTPESAVRVLLEFLAQRKREDRESGEIEALCARHPALATDLRMLWAEWVDADRSAMEDVASVMHRLAREVGQEVDPKVTLARDEAPDSDLASAGPTHGDRYARRKEIARGGMATIFRVRDAELR